MSNDYQMSYKPTNNVCDQSGCNCNKYHPTDTNYRNIHSHIQSCQTTNDTNNNGNNDDIRNFHDYINKNPVSKVEWNFDVKEWFEDNNTGFMNAGTHIHNQNNYNYHIQSQNITNNNNIAPSIPEWYRHLTGEQLSAYGDLLVRQTEAATTGFAKGGKQ